MKILIANNLYGRLQRGGAEVAISLLAKGLRTLGYEVVMVSSAPKPEKPIGKPEAKLYEIKSSYYNLGKYGKARKIIWHLCQFFALGKYKKIKKIVRKENPDLIITNNMMGMGWLSYFALGAKNKPIIQILHDVQLVYPSGLLYWREEDKLETAVMRIYRLIISIALLPVSYVVSPSKWLLDLHQQHRLFLNRNTAVIANPQDKEAGISLKEKGSSDLLKLIFVGQLERHKGVEFLKESLAKADWNNILSGRHFQRVRLEIIGSGSMTPETSSQQPGQIEISYLGRLEHEKVIEKIAESDILIFPSLCYENAPMTIKEAAVAGIGIIASDIGGVREMLPLASLFVPGDQDSLRETLKNKIREIEDGHPTTAVSPSPNPSQYARMIIDLIRTNL